MSETIVLAVDDTESSRPAARFVAEWARDDNSTIIVLHVLDRATLLEESRRRAGVSHAASHGSHMPPWAANAPVELIDLMKPKPPREDPQEILSRLVRQVTRQATDVLDEAGIAAERVRIEFLEGNAAKGIVEMAEDSGAQMIVVGAGGGSHTSRFFPGGVAQRVTQLAPCTVVVAR